MKLQDVTPPREVDAAFKDVQSAKEEREQKINEALGYRNEIIPQARGEAAQAIQQAEAFKQRRVKEAQGDAERFTRVLTEYRAARDVTRTRMYLETMQNVLADTDKVILDKSAGGTVPYLPLNELRRGLGSPSPQGGSQ